MSVKVMMCAMVAGTAAVVALGRRHEASPAPEHEKAPEAPWLSREAAAQIIGDGGVPGPLFAGLTLGGSAPLPEQRARIDAFAKANHVDIDLDVRDDELVAIRFGVTYHGCCGYEGADTLALRMRRPSYGGGCTGPWPAVWVNDWAYATEDGIHVRSKVRVNRVDVRWEHTESLAEVIEHADGMLGKPTSEVRDSERHRFAELVPHELYVVEAPLPFPGWPGRMDRHDLGIMLTAHAGRITEVSLDLEQVDSEQLEHIVKKWRHRGHQIAVDYGHITITSSG